MNLLESLKQHTTDVADIGDIDAINQHNLKTAALPGNASSSRSPARGKASAPPRSSNARGFIAT
jgi:hypothetical protein